MGDLVKELSDQLAEVRAGSHRRSVEPSQPDAIRLLRSLCCSQCREGLKAVESATTDATIAGAASAQLTTLEDRQLLLRLDTSGVRAACVDGGDALDSAAFDSVNSLLLNVSPGFVKHFNSSLASALAAASPYQPRWAQLDEGNPDGG